MLLHSQIIGSGNPLIILHGFLGMSDNWKTLGNRFAEHGFEVHLVDQRNHGRSFHDGTFSYGVMAQDLKYYCDAHELDSIALIGHSMGGKTAMEFATTFPKLVSKLVVADIAPKEYPLHHQDILKALSELDFEVIRSRGHADKVLGNYIKELGTRQFLLKNLYWIQKGQLALRINLPVLAAQVEAVGTSLRQDALYEGTTLFIRGGNSGYVESIDELLIKRHFPNAKIATIQGAGHWLHAENPSEFYQIVKDFL